MKTYSGTITKLLPNQIFCFGANTSGKHGKGAALFARQHCGAIYGVPRGPQGKAYAIITKDLTKSVHPSVSVQSIVEQIGELYDYAIRNPEFDFIVAYSGTGSNLNYYTPQEMADMFSSLEIPENIVFEESVSTLLKNENSLDTLG